MLPSGLNFTSDLPAMDDFAGRSRPSTVPADPTAQPMLPSKVLPVLDALNYDFDIVTVAPDPAQKAHLEALEALGQFPTDLNIEARWRDPRTVTAIARAGRAAQDVLKEAGFGTEPSGTRLPVGSYYADQDVKRHETVMRLTNLLVDQEAEMFEWGEFNCMAFFKAHAKSEPVVNQTTALAHLPIPKKRMDTRRKLAIAGCAVGVGLLGLAAISAL